MTMANFAATVETIAKTMYYDNEYMDALNVERVVHWDVVGEPTRTSYRDSAVKIIRALGLGFEWGVRSLEHIGDIETPYWNESLARIVYEELLDEEPEREPRLIQRLTGPWTEVE